MTLRIGHDVPFSPLDLFLDVETASSPRFRRLDALTINDGRRGFLIATAVPVRNANEGFVEKIKGSTITELVETVMNGREGWKTLPEFRSLADGRRDIGAGVPDVMRI